MVILMLPNTKKELAKYIDHTILKPDATWKKVENVIEEAVKYGFRGICIPPTWVKKAREALGDNSDIKISTVVGFPLGYTPINVKVSEVESYISEGADELDVVVNISRFKTGDIQYVEKEISSILDAASDKLVKLIIGTDYLSKDEIRKISSLAVELGVPVIKTNTGFGLRGATVEDVETIQEAIKGKALIKAAGGIRTALDALRFIKAGAMIIGTSSGVKIVEEFNAELLKDI